MASTAPLRRLALLASQLRRPSSPEPARVVASSGAGAGWVRVQEDERRIHIETAELEAAIPKRDPKHWMTGAPPSWSGSQSGRQPDVESCRAALRIDPNHANAHCNLGVALVQIGDTKGAIESCRAALRIDPNHANAQKMLALLQSG